MKIVIFGAGKFYKTRKEKLLSYQDINLVAIIDNNQYIQGTYIDGIPVLAMEQITILDFDIILLMSAKANEMKRQLLKLGVDKKKIWYWKQFESEKNRGTFYFYFGSSNPLPERKKVLIISADLNYTGGSLAAVYGAKALQMRNYNVVLTAPTGNSVFLKEMYSQGLNIVICPALPYLYEEELAFIRQFDAVIVNVFPMILCASEISKIRPVIWWIHEASNIYEASLTQFSEYMDEEKLRQIEIYAVSKIAQKNFNHYIPNRITKTLAYGIPDEKNFILKSSKKNKFLFAVIGCIFPLKAQDIFLQAVKKLPKELRKNGLFWIIGLLGQDAYSNQIRDMVSQEPSAALLGEMTREEIKKAYEEIDVLVCPSIEETMSIVVTEAMMYGKLCIVSDTVGMADYITDGENGFIFRMGDVDSLTEKMSWVFYHKEETKVIGEKARKTYEEHFTMESFGERLEEAIQQSLELDNTER